MNLGSIFRGDTSQNYSNCIYRILNTINGKSYIGQARDLLRRLVFDNRSHLNTLISYQNHRQLLYRALTKYGVDNFQVIILEKDLQLSEMGSKEIYWIQNLHTCIYDPNCNGYNMTWGGEDCSQLHTREARNKAMATAASYYDGDPYGMMHTEEVRARAYQNSLLSRERIYGTKAGALNSKSSIDARSRTRWIKIVNLILSSINQAREDGLDKFYTIGDYEKYRLPGSTQVHRRKLAYMLVTINALSIPGASEVLSFFDTTDLEPYYSELVSDQYEGVTTSTTIENRDGE